ncbi:hypothetical protein MXB_1713, partial [Myxobolus squamalis]
VEIKGYSFPYIQLTTQLFKLYDSRQLRIQVQVIGSLYPSGTLSATYLADVQQGECTGSLIFPNSQEIIKKIIEVKIFRWNSTEIFEIFNFRYDKLVIGHIFIAYGYLKLSMLRVTIDVNATIADIFRSIGKFQSKNQPKNTKQAHASCLNFWTLTRYQIIVKSAEGDKRSTSYRAILIRINADRWSGYSASLRFPLSSQKYEAQKCHEPKPILLVHGYYKVY